jgi:hypothetical protein
MATLKLSPTVPRMSCTISPASRDGGLKAVLLRTFPVAVSMMRVSTWVAVPVTATVPAMV